MRIKFTGFVEINDQTDSRSDADHELWDELARATEESQDADELFERLSLTYEVTEVPSNSTQE